MLCHRISFQPQYLKNDLNLRIYVYYTCSTYDTCTGRVYVTPVNMLPKEGPKRERVAGRNCLAPSCCADNTCDFPTAATVATRGWCSPPPDTCTDLSTGHVLGDGCTRVRAPVRTRVRIRVRTSYSRRGDCGPTRQRLFTGSHAVTMQVERGRAWSPAD